MQQRFATATTQGPIQQGLPPTPVSTANTSQVPGLQSTTQSGQQPQSQSQQQQPVDRDKIYAWIQDLLNPEARENALLELSKKREVVHDLAPLLWHSFGTIAALLQEIQAVYPMINPPNLTAHQSNRVCNALALLQCVASHSETRSAFLAAHIPLFLYPFLHTVSKTRPFEYLRLTSLGVIGALVKTDEVEVINFLLTTEIIPLCLRIMETGTELSKTVATFILQKILLDETGLSYICQTYERFSHVAMILGKMVNNLAREPSARLLKHVVRCYLRLSDNARAREALRQCLPDQLKDQTFMSILKEDSSTKRWLSQLSKSLNEIGPIGPIGPNPRGGMLQ
ncbi:CCR4-NOT transcription complex subunit 9-like [Oscarella lobularis]|uniref:CCR4-NOT transcription complex subunit 9-like n=1 Tax=Oscarella lobularis TaxID=121494 RepID=UPI003313ECB8